MYLVLYERVESIELPLQVMSFFHLNPIEIE